MTVTKVGGAKYIWLPDKTDVFSKIGKRRIPPGFCCPNWQKTSGSGIFWQFQTRAIGELALPEYPVEAYRLQCHLFSGKDVIDRSGRMKE